MLTSKLSFTEFFNSTWLKIPQVWRESDKDNGRPLQLIVLTFCQHMYYYFYEKIIHMDEIFDVDRCPNEYLKFLASILGWELIGQNPDSWRQQIRSCPLLYKLRGTKRGLMLAEKLVGYSVFMSELYRDYQGNFSTKERVFNSFPISMRMKPWFRKLTPPDIDSFIATDINADTFQAHNVGGGSVISPTGDLVYPRSLRKVSSSRRLSTIDPYNILTGVRSKARLAKTARYNFVLKKDTDLDYISPFTQKMTEVNIDGAIKLLMEFKPFHIYIQDLVIMVSLSDYLSLLHKPGDVEHLLFTDYDNTSVSLSQEEKQKFFKQDEFANTCNSSNNSTSFFNKGILELKQITLTTKEKTLVTSINTLSNLGLPLNGSIRKSAVGKPEEIWWFYDYSADTPVTDPEEHLIKKENSSFHLARDLDIYSYTYNQQQFFDKETSKTVLARDLGTQVKFGFYSISIPSIKDFEIVNLQQFFATRHRLSTFTSADVLSISHSPANYYSGKVTIKVDGDNFKTLTQAFLN